MEDSDCFKNISIQHSRYSEWWNILFPSFKLRSAKRFFSRSSSSRERHGDELVNQLRDTDACRGRTSVMFL
jgi:hypothetical protein